MKKILAVIVTMVFIIPMFVMNSANYSTAFITPTFAVDPANHNTSRSNKRPGGIIAADFLAGEGIIVDHRDNPDLYELDNNIQRQAVMKIVMKLSGKTITDTCRGEFSDVDVADWPCKYIEAALDEGYIAQNDTFRPYDFITLTEAMKLVLKAKGIEKIQETDVWQEDYMMTAYEYGIIDEKYYNYNDNATRGWIFEIATATIEQEKEIKEKQEELMSDEAM